MALVDHVKKEINAKIVYYGPERAGKTTSLRYIFSRIKPHLRGELKTVSVSGSSLLVFDFSPFEQPFFGDYRIRFHMYTLQGRVTNLAAWKMTLKGADGLVVVADASRESFLAARQSLVPLRDILGSYGVCFDDIPVVLQLNKSDFSDQLNAEVAAKELGLRECRTCPASALDGEGVLETLTAISRLVIGRIAERGDLPQECTVAGSAVVAEQSPVDLPADDTVSGDANENVWKVPQEYRQQQTVSAAVSVSGNVGQVAVVEEGVRAEGGRVVIPLDVTTSDGVRQRLVVTVAVTPG